MPAYVGKRTDGQHGVPLMSRRQSASVRGDDGEGCRLPLCIMYLDRTRSRSSPPRSKTPCARCAWSIEPTPQPRSSPRRSSSSPSRASATPSVCANARFNFYRNSASRRRQCHGEGISTSPPGRSKAHLRTRPKRTFVLEGNEIIQLFRKRASAFGECKKNLCSFEAFPLRSGSRHEA